MTKIVETVLTPNLNIGLENKIWTMDNLITGPAWLYRTICNFVEQSVKFRNSGLYDAPLIKYKLVVIISYCHYSKLENNIICCCSDITIISNL